MIEYSLNCLADVMYKLGAHTVIAVDVGAQDEQNFHNFGDQLSGKNRTEKTLIAIQICSI